MTCHKLCKKKDQDITNVMDLIKTAKRQMETMRKDGWDTLMHKTSTFCEKHGTSIPNMSDKLAPLGRPRRNVKGALMSFIIGFKYFILSLIYILKSLEVMRQTLNFLRPWLV